MTGPELMRSSSTILAEFSRYGARVMSITAKDKLRHQLGKDMDMTGGSVNFSSENADQCTMEENGIADVPELVGLPQPDMYSAELSLFVLEAGIKLLASETPDIMYLSLTDYIQHKYAPDEGEAQRYYKNMDVLFGTLDGLGAVVALTADHGMNDKSNDDGSLSRRLAAGRPRRELRPRQDARSSARSPTTSSLITARSAALCASIARTRPSTPAAIMDVARALPGIEAVYGKADRRAPNSSCRLDREGDVVVIGDAGTCIGSTPRTITISRP